MASTSDMYMESPGYTDYYSSAIGPSISPRMLAYKQRRSAVMARLAGRRGFTQVYLKRGSRASKMFFGNTRKSARGIQKYNRKIYGYRGRGAYVGQGEFYDPKYKEFGFTKEEFDALPDTSAVSLGGVTLPSVTGAPHMGPFNKVLEKPLSKRDAKYWFHDKQYGKLGWTSYFLPNEADKVLLQQPISHPTELVSQGIFGTKNLAGGFVDIAKSIAGTIGGLFTGTDSKSRAEIANAISSQQLMPVDSKSLRGAQTNLQPTDSMTYTDVVFPLSTTSDPVPNAARLPKSQLRDRDTGQWGFDGSWTDSDAVPSTYIDPYKPSSNIIPSFFRPSRSADAPISNSLVTTGKDPVPSFVAMGDGSSVKITHKEYIRDIYAPGTAFAIDTLAVNPGQEKTFPWLSQIAQNYDEYDLIQCMFSYRSTTSDIGSSTNGLVGTVIMSTQYNAEAPDFQDKQTMLQYEGSMSSKSTQDMIHGVECDPTKLSGPRGRFIRTGSENIGDDLNNFDHAKFSVAVVNAPSGFTGQSLGELWVSYTVVLRKPKNFTNIGYGISRDIFYSPSPAATDDWFNLASSTQNLFAGQQNNIGVVLSRPGASQVRLTFPSYYNGFVKIQLRCRYSAALGATANFARAAAGNIYSIPDTFSSAADVPVSEAVYGNLAGSTAALNEYCLRVVPATGNTANTITITHPTLSVDNCSIDIQEYNTIGYKGDMIASGALVAVAGKMVFVDPSGNERNFP